MTNYYRPKGKDSSIWTGTANFPEFPNLSTEEVVDVAILGGGITGITCALLVQQAGFRVSLVEARQLTSSVTAKTTAKITSLHGPIYDKLISEMGLEAAQKYADANQSAIGQIESIIKAHQIDCDFSRLPFALFTLSEQHLQSIHNELRAGQKVGLPVVYTERLPGALPARGAILLNDQAQFHPMKYLRGLINVIQSKGGAIYENTRAMAIERGNVCTVKTNRGDIKAKKVVIATNYPVSDVEPMFFARLYASRSYAMAVKARNEFPRIMLYQYESPGLALRAQPVEGGELVVISGEEHRTGISGNTLKYYTELEKRARDYLDIESVEYHWSNQDVMTIDGLPYIGRHSKDSERIYVATGYNKWGMTTGTVAAMIISDLIWGRENPWSDLYKPSRFSPVASAKNFVSHLFAGTEGFLGRRISTKNLKSSDDLDFDEGMVADLNGTNVAVYKHSTGAVLKLNPTCPHMKCIVSFNNAERSWDCPCHGSRFNFEGQIIQGPATSDLQKAE